MSGGLRLEQAQWTQSVSSHSPNASGEGNADLRVQAEIRTGKEEVSRPNAAQLTKCGARHQLSHQQEFSLAGPLLQLNPAAAPYAHLTLPGSGQAPVAARVGPQVTGWLLL